MKYCVMCACVMFTWTKKAKDKGTKYIIKIYEGVQNYACAESQLILIFPFFWLLLLLEIAVQ